MSMGTDVISIYIFIQFMETFRYRLDESAFIDGASYFAIYWKIILPLLKPAIVTSMVLKGVGVYNGVLLRQSVSAGQEDSRCGSNLPVYLHRTSWQQIQSDLCRCTDVSAACIDRIPALSETDLQWNHLRRCQGLIQRRVWNMKNAETKKMREEIKKHLTEGIIPFWKGMAG